MSDTQINIGVNAEGVVAGVNKAKQELNSLNAAVDKVSAIAKQGGESLGKLGENVDATKAAAQLSRLAQQVKRVSEEAALGRNSVELFAEKLSRTGVSPEIYRPLIEQFAKVKEAAAQANSQFTQSGKAMTEYGMGVKATSAALRQLPAQFTDIVVSLQGGQAPLTVLLQQGGQLKDVFGGVGNAAKAMGNYLLGLLNPYTLAAASAAALGVAYYQGSKELDAYNKALVMSGNAAGTTAGQLQSMAQSAAKASGSTISVAADALAQLAGTGDIAAANLIKFTDTAVRLEREAGIAVKDTVKAFSELGNDPVKASEKLTEKTHYLTAEIYRQIKALEDQGDKVGAASLAQNAYADAMNQRIPELTQNLGTLEKAWRGIAGTAKGAWDSMLGIGRKESIEEKIRTLQMQRNYIDSGVYVGFGNSEKNKADLDAQLEYYKHILASEQDLARSKAESTKQDEASIALSKEADKYASKQVQMQREIAKVKGEYLNSNRTSEDTAAYTESVKGIVEKFKETAAAVKGGISDIEKAMRFYNDLMDKSSGYTATYAEDQNKLALALRKGKISYDEYAVAAQQLVQSQPIVTEQQRAQEKAVKEAAKAYEDASKGAISYYKTLDDGNDKLEKSVENLREEVAGIGKSKEYKEELTLARNQAALATAQENLALMNLQNSSEIEIQNAQRTVDLLKEKSKLLNQAVVATGADELAKANKKAAEESSKYWEDALMRAFESGKGFFQSLWDTIKNTLKTQVIKVLIQPAMGVIGSAVAGTLGLSNVASAASAIGTGSSLISGASLLGSVQTGVMNGLSAWAEGGSITGMLSNASLYSTSEIVGALSPIALGIGALVAIANASQGETRNGGQYGYSFDGTSATNARRGTTVTATGIGATYLEGPSGGEIAGDAARTLIDTTVSGINAVLKQLGSAATLTGFQAALESSDRNRGGVFAGGTLSTGATFGESGRGDNYAGTLYDSRYGFNMDSKAAMTAFTTDLKMATIEALQAATDLPKTVSEMLKGVDTKKLTDEAATALLTDINAVGAGITTLRDSFKSLPFESLTAMSFDATASLLAAAAGTKAVGESMDSYLGRGLQALTANLSGFYQNFYSSAEQTANQTRYVSNAFKSLGITMPSVNEQLKAWYRGQVEAAMALDQSVPANAKALAGLLALQSGVNELGNSAITAANSIKDAVSGISTSVKDTLFDFRYGMASGDPAKQYQMLDTKAAEFDALMRSATSVQDVARYAQSEIDVAKQAWGLLDDSQKTQGRYEQYAALLNGIDEYVKSRGADALGLQSAANDAAASTIASATGTAVSEALTTPAASLEAAAASLSAVATASATGNTVVVASGVSTAPTTIGVSTLDGYDNLIASLKGFDAALTALPMEGFAKSLERMGASVDAVVDNMPVVIAPVQQPQQGGTDMAAVIAAAVEAAVSRAMSAGTQPLADATVNLNAAAGAINAAADKPAVAYVNVNVSAPRGSEVSVS